MTVRAAPRRRVTIREIAGQRGVSVETVRGDRWQFRDFPPSVGMRRGAGPGRPALEYDAAAVRRFYAGRDAAARDTSPRPPGSFSPEDRVTSREGAARLGLNYNTFRSLPATCKDTGNPFPRRGDDRRYRWGDLQQWDQRRRAARARPSLPPAASSAGPGAEVPHTTPPRPHQGKPAVGHLLPVRENPDQHNLEDT